MSFVFAGHVAQHMTIADQSFIVASVPAGEAKRAGNMFLPVRPFMAASKFFIGVWNAIGFQVKMKRAVSSDEKIVDSAIKS